MIKVAQPKQPESKGQYILGHKYAHLEEKTIHVAKDMQATLENRKQKLLCVPLIRFEVQLVFSVKYGNHGAGC